MFLQVIQRVHLGHHKTQEGLREKFEERLGVYQEDLRMVSVRFTRKEGKTSKDCPIAKWILLRPGLHEKYLVVVYTVTIPGLLLPSLVGMFYQEILLTKLMIKFLL